MLHWTLFALEGDPSGDYMYTYPNALAADRNGADTAGAPEMLAPLIKDGIERAFRLTALTGPLFDNGERKTDETELLLSHGKIDLLPGVTDRPLYKQAKYEQKFLLCGRDGDADRVTPEDVEAWGACISQVKNYLNAAMGDMRIVTDTDRGFFRRGRFRANVTELKNNRAIITITGMLDPFKYERCHSAEPWVWADFSFVDGIIREYGEITVTHEPGEYMTLQIPMRGGDVTPEFKRVDAGDDDNDVQVCAADPDGGNNWTNAAFAQWARADDKTVLYTKGLTLEGCRMPGQTRALYLRGNGKKIAIRMRGVSL